MREMIHGVSLQDNTDRIDIVSSLEDMAYDKTGDAARLKKIYLERVKKGRGESTEQFGIRSGLGTSANVRHYLNGRNSLDVNTARRFAMHIPCRIEEFSTHWARLAHSTGQLALADKDTPSLGHSPSSVGEPAAAYHATHSLASDTTIRIPLLSWGQVDQMLEHNESLAGSPGIEFVDSDGENVGDRTKFLEMPDHSMEPRIRKGDRLTLEPDWKPEAGEVVLVKDKHGAHHIRMYRQVRPGHFIAVPFNAEDFAELDSISEGLTPIAVVTARREMLAKRRR